MSKSAEPASGREHDGLPERSVYDFFYSDNKRIGSYLSQFDDSGLLEKLTQTEGATKSVKRGFKFSLGGGATVVGTGGTGSVGLELGPGEQGNEGLQRVYDPLWTNALTLLDFLFLEDLVQKEISAARIGQFVLLRGRLSVFDMVILKGLWSIPAVKDVLSTNSVAEKKAAFEALGQTLIKSERNRLEAKWKSEAATEMGFNLDILNLLPHSIVCSVKEGENSAWCSLQPESLVAPSTDLLLKYGINIEGEWAMLAVLDALPSEPATPENTAAAMTQDAMSLGGLWAGIMAMTPVIRTALGRPEGSYGVTPLLIFREVSG